MGNERMERKITIEEHVLYKEDYQMKMLKANSPEGFLKVAGRGMNGSSYYDYDVSGKISMQAMYTRDLPGTGALLSRSGSEGRKAISCKCRRG